MAAPLETTAGASPWLRRNGRAARGRLAAAVALGELTGILMVLQTGLLAKVTDALIVGHAAPADLLPLAAVAAAVISARAAAAAAARRVAFSCASAVKRSLRAQCMRRIASLGPIRLAGLKAGELSHVVVDAVEALDSYYSRYLPQRAVASLLPFTVLVVVFPLDWISGLVLALTAVFLPISMVVIGDEAHARTQRLWARLAAMSGRFLDILQGLATVRMFGAARREAAEIERASREHRALTMSVLRIAFLSSFMLELIAAVSIAIVAVISGFRLLHGSVAYGTAWFILLAAPEYFLALRTLGTLYHARMEAMSAAEQIEGFLGSEEALSGRPSASAGEPRRIGPSPTVTFRQVVFSYDRTTVLSGLSLDVAAGEHVALLGPSGSGKSTVLALLLGFAQPEAGSIEIGGVPLRDLLQDPGLEAWRRCVSWLPQRPTLFQGTLRDNLLLGRQGTGDAVLRRAMRSAHLDELDLETELSEAGLGVSTGQAQRIALARLFLRDPALVLLDEPTAHLDERSESLVLQSIRELCRGRTAILVTHREDTAADMDRAVRIEKGRAE